MLNRAIALSLALLIGIGAIIPLATQQTEAGPRKHRKHHRHYKKYLANMQVSTGTVRSKEDPSHFLLQP